MPFRNHELLNAVMIRENARIMKVLISNDQTKLVFLRADMVCVRLLGDLNTRVEDIGPSIGTDYQSIAISNDDNYLAVGVAKNGAN